MSDRRETTQQPAGPRNPADWSRIPYMDDPDYSKPLLEIPADIRERMLGRLRFLYGEAKARQAMPELERILRVHHAHKPVDLLEAEHGIDPAERFTERDLVLITYGDMVEGPEAWTTRSCSTGSSTTVRPRAGCSDTS